MPDFEIVLNTREVGKLLKSKEIMEFCESTAENYTRKTGMPYRTQSYTAATRVVAKTLPPKKKDE